MWNLHNIGKLRGSDMLAIERKNEILDKLRAEQRVLVSDLAEYYNVTEETIRRDLDKLEKEGYATKTYGGAILGNSTKTDLSYTIRNKTNVEAKNQIAALASRLIEDGDHLMLDDSSTSLYLAKKLKEKKNLTVITNSVELVVELNGIDGWTIILTGGRLKPDSLALVISQSGETEPVLNDVRHARQHGQKIISFTRRSDSTLAQLSDLVFVVDGAKQTLAGSLPNLFFGHIILIFEELMARFFSPAPDAQ